MTGGEDRESRGLTPRLLEAIFDEIAKRERESAASAAAEKIKFSVFCEFLEIYNGRGRAVDGDWS